MPSEVSEFILPQSMILPFETVIPEELMQEAIRLARKAEYQTEPNPIVGALLADPQGNILSSGFHQKPGKAHAEVMALQGFEQVPPEATLYVTLEPCSHFGKTPPCAELLLQKQVKQVVVGCLDPNPLVAGRGVALLREKGVQVKVGLCEQDCIDLNPVFNKHIVTHLPYVTLKAATSLDGKIAMPSGESQWITGAEARAYGHLLRSRHQAIVVGSQTLLKDNPQLTNRIEPGQRQPIRIAFSSLGNIQEETSFLQNQETQRIVVAGCEIKDKQLQFLQSMGVKVLVAPTARPAVRWALEELYTLGICSLLVEGGAELVGSFLQEGLVDQLCLFLSGKLIASPEAPAWCGNLGISHLADVPHFKFKSVKPMGDDLLITGYLQ